MSEHTSLDNATISGEIKWKDQTPFNEHRTEPATAEILFNEDKITEIPIQTDTNTINTTIPLSEIIKDQDTVTGDLKIQIGNDSKILDQITITNAQITFNTDKNEWTNDLITLTVKYLNGTTPVPNASIKIDILDSENLIFDSITGTTNNKGVYNTQLLYDDYVDFFNGDTIVFQAYVNGNQFPNNRKVITVRENIPIEYTVHTKQKDGANVIELPSPTYDITDIQVNWGDGNGWEDTVDGADHSYNEAGTYTIKVRPRYSTEPITTVNISQWNELESVKLSPTVTGNIRIQSCANLDSVQMADNLISVSGGDLDLSENPKLTYVKLAEGWSNLSSSSLDGCVMLNQLILPESLNSIDIIAGEGLGADNLITEFNWIEDPDIISFSTEWGICIGNRKIAVPLDAYDDYLSKGYPETCLKKQIKVSFNKKIQNIMGDDASTDGKLEGELKLVTSNQEIIPVDLGITSASICFDKGNNTFKIPMTIMTSGQNINTGKFSILANSFNNNLTKGFNTVYLELEFDNTDYVLSDNGNSFEFEIVDWYMGANVLTDNYSITDYGNNAQQYNLNISVTELDDYRCIYGNMASPTNPSAYQGKVVTFNSNKNIPQFTHWKLEAYVYLYKRQSEMSDYNNTIDIVNKENTLNSKVNSNEMLLGTWTNAMAYMGKTSKLTVKPRLLNNCWYKFEMEQSLSITDNSTYKYTIRQLDDFASNPRGTVLEQGVSKITNDSKLPDIPSTLKWVLTGQSSANYIQDISIRVQDDALPVKRIYIDNADTFKEEYTMGEIIHVEGHIDPEIDKNKIKSMLKTSNYDNNQTINWINDTEFTIDIPLILSGSITEPTEASILIHPNIHTHVETSMYIVEGKHSFKIKPASVEDIVFNVNNGEDFYTLDTEGSISIPVKSNISISGTVELVTENTVLSTVNCTDSNTVIFDLNKDNIPNTPVSARINPNNIKYHSTSNSIMIYKGVNMDNVTVNYR